MFIKLKIYLKKIYFFLLSFLIIALNYFFKKNILTEQKNLLNWIFLAQKVNNSYGISKGYSFIKSYKFLESWYKEYPETTGYLIPTLLDLSVKKNIYPYKNILLAADWLMSIQNADGSFKGGTIDSNDESSIFDTGQIIKGFYSLYKYNKNPEYLNSSLRACNWILRNEHMNQGYWNKFKTKGLKDSGLTFNIYAIDTIAEIGRDTSNSDYMNLAKRVGQFTLMKIKENTWVEGCELSQIKYPVTHTLAYTIEGLYNIGSILNNDMFVKKSLNILDVVNSKIEKNGYLPGYFDKDWNKLDFGSCLTGSAQIACMCVKAYKLTKDVVYLEFAKNLYKYLSLRLNNYFNNFGGAIGSMPSSWPINGRYFAYNTTNWTIKYMLDLTVAIDEYL
jgi:uncharacterized protein YyaL (SSP411 family)